eukprot:TRINITY_DN1784_c0_g2_i11.p1 TRINITY_DN1784_c0_g2~~TRINITY_DN1784_c0_g2_i11.p1  ORF type:complete len:144 (-),score=7.64 TRINITY_DN1784_c0_g2_i11:2-433(-)
MMSDKGCSEKKREEKKRERERERERCLPISLVNTVLVSLIFMRSRIESILPNTSTRGSEPISSLRKITDCGFQERKMVGSTPTNGRRERGRTYLYQTYDQVREDIVIQVALIINSLNNSISILVQTQMCHRPSKKERERERER